MNNDGQMTELLTANEVSKILNLTLASVYRLAREGDIPSVKFNERTVRFDPDEIEQYINQHRAPQKNGND